MQKGVGSMNKHLVFTQLICGFAGCFLTSLVLATPWTLRWSLQLGLSYVVFLALLALSWCVAIGCVRLLRRAR